MQKTTILFTLGFILSLVMGCDDASNSPTLSQPERNLSGTLWKAEGFYNNGQSLNTPVPRLEINFKTTGVTGVPGTIEINGQIMPALWTINNNILRITYPSGISEENGIPLSAQEINVSLSSNQLELFAPASEPLVLFGIITIPNNGSIRLNENGASATTEGTDNQLTTGNWESIGYFVNDVATGTNPNATLRFRTTWGVNSVFVNNIPAPATWAISGNILTFTYPTTSGTSSQSFIYQINSGVLSLEPENQVNTNIYDVITIEANQELRFQQQ